MFIDFENLEYVRYASKILSDYRYVTEISEKIFFEKILNPLRPVLGVY